MIQVLRADLKTLQEKGDPLTQEQINEIELLKKSGYNQNREIDRELEQYCVKLADQCMSELVQGLIYEAQSKKQIDFDGNQNDNDKETIEAINRALDKYVGDTYEVRNLSNISERLQSLVANIQRSTSKTDAK